MTNFKHIFLKSWELTLEMTKNEIKARYKNAFFGFLWAFLNPLIQMLVIGFIFQYFIKTPIPDYFSFLFLGLLVWNFFSYSLIKTAPSIVYARDLIHKANFPRESIPLSIVFSNFFNFLIAFFLFFIFLLIFRELFLFSGLFSFSILIASFLWIIFLTSGLALLCSALNVKYRDINFFIQALIIIWFYATPIIYSLNILPERYLKIFILNPIVYPLEMLRFSLLGTNLPSIFIFYTNLFITLILIVSGVLIFKKENKTFSDWL